MKAKLVLTFRTMGDCLAGFDALVVMTGRQLWSHLDALAQWGDGLRNLTILTAADDHAPDGPAERLRRFAAKAFPRLTVTVVGPVHDDDPEAVFRTIAEVVDELGGNIVVNASGGTRLMFLGASKARHLLPAITTVFRDDHGPWYRLTADGGAECLGFLDADATERFDVIDLLEVTWADEVRRVIHRPAEPPKYLMTAAVACLRGKHFERAFNEAQDQAGNPRTDGYAFERFVQALILELGADSDDIAVSVELRDGQKGVQEVDVVVNANGRLHVIDCKYRAKSDIPIGTQIREAYSTRQHLGDDTAQVILLRPLQHFPDQSRALASDYGIRVLDRTMLTSRSLPEQLSLLLGIGSRHLQH